MSGMLRQLADLRSGGPAFVWAPPPRQAWGAGVMVPSDWQWYLTPWSVGHDGAGGQVPFGDPTARLGFGYITNRLRPDGDAANSIIAALANVLH